MENVCPERKRNRDGQGGNSAEYTLNEGSRKCGFATFTLQPGRSRRCYYLLTKENYYGGSIEIN
jgi:hypothetical protein